MISSRSSLPAAALWLAFSALAGAAEPPASLTTTPAVPANVEAALIPDYTRLTPALAAAGQPTPEAVAKLAAMGFKTVVNLRAESEPGVAGEAEALRAQGLDYVSVPVTADDFSLAVVAAVQRVLDDPARAPVLLHCNSSNRVGGVWAVIQARTRGLSAEDAVIEGRKAGLHSQAMIDAVTRVLGEAPPAPPVGEK